MFPDPPGCSFASDNAAGIHPEVLAAISEANSGHALAYGADRWTSNVEKEFNETRKNINIDAFARKRNGRLADISVAGKQAISAKPAHRAR